MTKRKRTNNSAFSICEFCLPVSLFFLPLFRHFLFICGFWSHNSIYRLYSPWMVPHVEQELLILPEYLNWLPVFSKSATGTRPLEIWIMTILLFVSPELLKSKKWSFWNSFFLFFFILFGREFALIFFIYANYIRLSLMLRFFLTLVYNKIQYIVCVACFHEIIWRFNIVYQE
jgi:hypothetical protein